MIREKLKNFFSNPKEIISFFLPIIIAIVLLIPVPYYVTAGGGTINVDKKIIINNNTLTDGSIHAAYVKEIKGTVISYILAKIIPSYELTKIEEVTLEEESQEEYNLREKMYFTNSIDNAIRVAYNKANKEFKVINEKFKIIYIDKKAITDLEVGDQLLEINGKDINSLEMFTNEIKKYNKDDVIKIKVLRNNKELTKEVKIITIDNEQKIGIYVLSEYDYETNPKLELKFSNKEAGPSGGLMISLSIYNKLVQEDITKGLTIAGTGTIDQNGNVGEIGGVKYKVEGAVKEKADVFLVPMDNYDEALAKIKENNYNIKLIGVATFDEAIKELSNLEVN